MTNAPASRKDRRWPDLATIRERLGLTLVEIESNTKISRRFLEAIEKGQWQRLPGGVYNVSYLRQYAREIDVNEEQLLEQYRVCTGQAAEDRQPNGNGDRVRSRVMGRFLTLLPRL